ncbi:hypothetical protein ACWY4P_48430 [Streptomyces sp. LZ34]
MVRHGGVGDQGTPTVGKLNGPKPPKITERLTCLNDNLGSPYANDVTTAVERIAPLFHLVNGDLCYANLSEDRLRTWSDWFDMTSRSSRFRPWRPAAGDHENELGNGPIGFAAYQAYFSLPGNGGDDETQGLWYAFTVGSVRVVSLANGRSGCRSSTSTAWTWSSAAMNTTTSGPTRSAAGSPTTP